jgi:tetratricopeptide (TPR) repeat protein
MGHTLKGYFYLLFANPTLDGRTAQAIAAAEKSSLEHGANQRELRHISALKAWFDEDLVRAVQIWEDILLEHPLDAVALRLAYHTYFYLGDFANGRDLPARVMHAWNEDVPCYGFILGVYAFALEEAGDYGAAERLGRRAVDLNAGDIWAVHSVCHVLEMQGRHREGIDWVKSTEPGWRHCNNFRYHIWWHRTLFHLELDQYDEVLELYDTEVRADKSNEYLDICNAASLLWRLEARGVAVGDRWEELASVSEERIDDHVLAFVNAHFAMALTSGGRTMAVEQMLENLRGFALDGSKTEAGVTSNVGLPLCEALVAYRSGSYAQVVDLLQPIRYSFVTLGGSHAQRDLFVETLINAALKSEQFALARSLLSERTALKARSPSSWRQLAAAHKGLGDKQRARAAEVKAAEVLSA